METTHKARSLGAWQTFLSTSIDERLQQSLAKDPEVEVVKLFQRVAHSVPAYGSFWRSHGIEASAIQTFADFQTLPLSTKDNYIKPHQLSELCYQGKLTNCDFIAASSGSTGQPTFWTRFVSDEWEIVSRFEQIFRHAFQADTGSTLAMVCFSLGTWVGGMYTANCCRHLAAKGYPLTVITPGNNPGEIFRTVRQLAPMFDRLVLLGYPPFLKDVIDRGLAEGIPWWEYNVRLVMAGEVFSEEWRDLVGSRLGSTDAAYDSASLYGTADAGVLGNETPVSIIIRRWLSQHPDAARELFGESRLPTLIQYDPISRFFETEGDTLLFSGDNGIPLIRYHIADRGGIISYQTMLEFLSAWNFNPISQLLPDRAVVYALPFAYIFGRANFIVSIYGANVYPENIQVGLEQPEIAAWVTGKFVMEVRQDGDRNSYLSLTVELAPNINAPADGVSAIAESVLERLRRLNSEYANYVPAERQLPQVSLLPFGDPEYFPVGVKHRYTRNNT
jgi:phenylacetate-CoA ligase